MLIVGVKPQVPEPSMPHVIVGRLLGVIKPAHAAFGMIAIASATTEIDNRSPTEIDERILLILLACKVQMNIYALPVAQRAPGHILVTLLAGDCHTPEG